MIEAAHARSCSGWFHGPRLSRNDQYDGLSPNAFFDAFSQCTCDSAYIGFGLALIRSVRKSALRVWICARVPGMSQGDVSGNGRWL